jgi:hypothetical protein
VTRQQLWLIFGNFRELTFEGLTDACVKRASRLAQQRAVGRVLDQSVLKQIAGMWWHTLPKKQSGLDKAVK